MFYNLQLTTYNFRLFVVGCLSLVIFLVAPLGARAGTIIKGSAYLGLQRGLVGCWNFDSDYTQAPDCSGNNNVGTLTGPTKAKGKIGQALNFDGVDDIVSTGIFATIPDSITLSAWIYPTDGGDVFVEQGASGWQDSQMEVMSTGEIKVGYWSGGMSILSLGTFSLNSWHHVVLTFDNSNNLGSGYVDGVFRNSGVSDKLWPTNDLQFSLGFANGTNLGDGTYFNGKIDEARVYNRALSANEISRLYRIGLGSTANRLTSSMDRGLVGHWTFDETDIGSSGTVAKDRSGNNNNGIITGAVAKRGKVGQALSFISTKSQYVSLPSGGWGTLLGNSSNSISVWVKTNLPTTRQAITADFHSSGSGASLELEIQAAGNYRYGIAGLGSFSFATGGNVDKNWHHLVGTFDDSLNLVVLYIDSVFIDSFSQTNAMDSGDTKSIGRDGAFDADYFDGQIDDVRIYNRALSAAEVSRLYNSTQSRFNSSKTDSLTNGLVGYWTFDEADTGSSGTVAKDRSGNNSNGIITGAVAKRGKIGQALSFDVLKSQNVQGDPNSVLDITNGTLSAWIYPTGMQVGQGYGIVHYPRTGGNPGNFSWFLSVQNTDRVYVNLQETPYVISGVVTQNEWQLITATFDGSNVVFYKNGVRVDSVQQTSTPDSDNSTSFFVGGNQATATFFNGLIDDVRVYNRALSASEVNKLYQMGR